MWKYFTILVTISIGKYTVVLPRTPSVLYFALHVHKGKYFTATGRYSYKYLVSLFPHEAQRARYYVWSHYVSVLQKECECMVSLYFFFFFKQT